MAQVFGSTKETCPGFDKLFDKHFDKHLINISVWFPPASPAAFYENVN